MAHQDGRSGRLRTRGGGRRAQQVGQRLRSARRCGALHVAVCRQQPPQAPCACLPACAAGL